MADEPRPDLLSSLTLSKTKDNGSQSLENSNGNNPSPQDFRNLGADFGVSNYDQPYNSTTSFVWALPFGKGRRWASNASPLLEALVGGWQVAGINSVYAGEPVTFIYNARRDVHRVGHRAGFPRRQQLPAERHVRSAGDRRRPHDHQLVQSRRASCVPTDPSQPFGNAPRNSVRGPKFWQFDIAASKKFALGGPARFEFRLEAFNLLNRTNFRAPNGNRSAGGLRHDHRDLRSAPAATRVQAAVVGAL